MSLSSTSPKRIHLLGTGRHEEGTAGGTISPGHLIMLNSSNTYVVHNDAYGKAERIFAKEDATQGNSIDDNYSSGDLVMMVVANPGDVVYAKLAAGEVAVIGTKLCSAGDGTLLEENASDVAQERVAVALEALNLADSNETSAAFIKVRVL